MTRRLLALALLATVLLAGCSRNVASDTDPTPSNGVPPPLTVATVDFPSTWLAEQVGGKGVVVQRVGPAELATTESDVLVYVPGLDPAVDAAAQSLPPESVVDVTADVTQLANPRNPEQRDPYAWLDPLNISTMAETLSKALTDASPTTYDANQYYGLRALGTQNKAGDLDQSLQEKFDTCRVGTLVVDAPVLTYLARTYAFEQVPLLLWKPAKQPVRAVYYTPEEARPVRKAAKDAGVDAVRIESLAHGAPADDLLAGVAMVGDRIAKHQNCPVATPVSTDRPG